METTIRIQVPRLHGGQESVKAQARRFNVLSCGRRWGKTEFGLSLVLDTVLSQRPCAWFAPTYKTLLEQWSTCKSRFAPILTSSSSEAMKLSFLGGGIVDFWSSDNPDSGRGRKYARVIVDEAAMISQLKQAWEQTIRPTLADFRGDAWFLSTPKPAATSNPAGLFFDEIFRKGQSVDGPEDKKRLWQSWRRPTIENPWISPDEIEAARMDLPDSVFAQEFLGVPMGDDQAVFFKSIMLDQVRERCCRVPDHLGEVVYELDTETEQSHYSMRDVKFIEGHTLSRFKWWGELVHGRPRQDRNYLAFADLSQGVGASNSSLGIACVDTREQVGAFTTAGEYPDKFAHHSVAILRWVGGQDERGPLLGWESNGPGQVFGREVMRLGYYHVWGGRDIRQWSDSTDQNKIGWWSTRDSKAVLLSDLRRAWTMGEYIPRESQTLQEALEYVYYPSGAIGPARLTTDAEGARSVHGDRVIRDGGMVMLLRHAASAAPAAPVYDEYSYIALRQAYDRRESEMEDESLFE